MHKPPCRYAHKPGALAYAPGTLDGCTCSHDPLCPSSYTMVCECHLIDEVRRDERMRHGIEDDLAPMKSTHIDLSGPETDTSTDPCKDGEHVIEEWRGRRICIECGTAQDKYRQTEEQH